MKKKELWYPYRWGLTIRSALRKFASLYGGRFFFIRRPLAVFLATLLDESHQETFENTHHWKELNGIYD